MFIVNWLNDETKLKKNFHYFHSMDIFFEKNVLILWRKNMGNVFASKTGTILTK